MSKLTTESDFREEEPPHNPSYRQVYFGEGDGKEIDKTDTIGYFSGADHHDTGIIEIGLCTEISTVRGGYTSHEVVLLIKKPEAYSDLRKHFHANMPDAELSRKDAPNRNAYVMIKVKEAEDFVRAVKCLNTETRRGAMETFNEPEKLIDMAIEVLKLDRAKIAEKTGDQSYLRGTHEMEEKSGSEFRMPRPDKNIFESKNWLDYHAQKESSRGPNQVG